MQIEQIEELFLRVYKIQPMMISIATWKAEIIDYGENYEELYSDIEVDIELLQEDGIALSNPNPFQSLTEWRNNWSHEDSYNERREYVSDLYEDFLFTLGNLLVSLKSQDDASLHVDAQNVEQLVSDIEEVKSIMFAIINRDSDIDTEESSYFDLNSKALKFVWQMQRKAIPIIYPNQFASLWQWHALWKAKGLDSRSSRREEVSALYANLLKQMRNALIKHERKRSSSNEFLEDLRFRFRTNSKELPCKSPSTKSSTKELTLLSHAREVKINNEAAHDIALLNQPDNVLAGKVSTNGLIADAKERQKGFLSDTNSRMEFREKLASLFHNDFEQLIFALRAYNLPSGVIPPEAAAQSRRVSALLEWAESSSGCGLNIVSDVLEKVIGGNR